MSDFENVTGSDATLKQMLLAALNTTMAESQGQDAALASFVEKAVTLTSPLKAGQSQPLAAPSVKSAVESSTWHELPASASSRSTEDAGSQSLSDWKPRQNQEAQHVIQWEEPQKTEFDDTLSMRGVVPDVQTETLHPAGSPSSLFKVPQVKSNSIISGGSMADLSGYKDLSKAPISFGDDDLPLSSLSADSGYERGHHQPQPSQFQHSALTAAQHFAQEATPQEVDTEFSGNVKTLIRLVNELPDGVTKQTGAQIIRLTMEAMGISMEDVLSEAQSAQSEMLDAVRANIKKIEEYKTVIRKLETDIKYYQGKANELSEIIDLFILSNTTGNKMPMPDDLSH